MKYSLSIGVVAVMYLVLLMNFSACDQHATTAVSTDEASVLPTEIGYDSLRAAKVGADQYGMKKYIMVLLKKGPNRNLNQQETLNVQTMHMANIRKLAEQGILVLSGPFGGDGDLRGIFILNMDSLEEAEHLISFDPAIKEGTLVMELYEWYGSAAVMEINDIHNAISKFKI